MRLRTKIGLNIVVLFMLLVMVVSLLQKHWVENIVIEQAQQRVKQNIRSAWHVLGAREAVLNTIAAFLANHRTITGGTDELQAYLDKQKQRLGLHFLFIVDRKGIVQARAGNVAEDGQTIPLHLWEEIVTNQALSGYALFPASFIEKASEPVRAQFAASQVSDTGLVIYAAHVIEDNAPAPRILVAATLLNGANDLVDDIQDTIFLDTFYEGRRAGTATIFQGSRRVATTVLLDNEQRAIGTTVSSEVARQVLGHDVPWTGRAYVVNDWYVSQYDPIRDSRGNVIGMLYLGELEQIFLDIQRNVLLANVAVLLAIMSVVFLISYWISRRLLYQISVLDDATLRFSDGDLTARANIESRDEVGDLAKSFNTMADVIEKDRKQILQQNRAIETVNGNYMEMLSFVNHEVRSTLGAALFNVQLLKDGSYGPVDEDHKEGLMLVEDSLTFLNELSENYLQLSRIEKGELAASKKHVKVKKEIITPVLANWASQIQLKFMQVRVDVDDSLVVMADENLLRVVYDNLVGNAIKYGRKGGQIILGVHDGESSTELSVFNEGQGIPHDRITRLFQRFQRYDVDESTGRRGTGLGLFIVKQIASLHGGKIAVDSVEGESVTFRISLPK
ncbi:MAG: cache domain-containing protein [Candidatus Hydrogenedentes bacterium]|nr:cache domain-containing protein [Candidatus Hydrogenedentota bacterium]